MKQTIAYLILFLLAAQSFAQPSSSREIKITVVGSKQAALPLATVSLLKTDSSLIKAVVTDSAGIALFTDVSPGNYIVRVTRIDHHIQHTPIIDLQNESSFTTTVVMTQAAGMLQNVTVTARKPLIQIMADKTVVNVEAGITNAGSTVLEVLERSPGVTLDKDGNISLKGKPGVQIMIDGKPAQLGGTDLQNMLQGMSASQVETIELMDNPSAKYDAAGNAGIINIKLKKNKQRGFNGSASTNFAQGRYPKTNSSVNLNFRNGDVNLFLTYSFNYNQYLLDMYALRTYYKPDGVTESALLEQPYFTTGTTRSHNLKTGVDYFVTPKTTVGLAFTGVFMNRGGEGKSTALWMKPSGEQDSSIRTYSTSVTDLKQAGVNFNARHVIDANRELTADVDLIGYNINTGQFFENQLVAPNSVPEASEGKIPSTIRIISAKADYSQRVGGLLWESGAKTARVSTENPAQYFIRDAGGDMNEDFNRSNHFVYTENIHALYTNFNKKLGKWSVQAGLRFEHTAYEATQLGNAVRTKDSTFTRNYSNLFPTTFISWEADSNSSFTFRLGRRIDRPAYQNLNPFEFIINKYTSQRGNSNLLPQYTWNFEVSHIYKQAFSTTLSYNVINDYFSQVFYADQTTGHIVYTQGNVGKMQNFGLSMSAQVSVAKWWSLSGQATMNHKKFEGVLWKEYKASITQLNASVNNQFRFKKGWGAELSGVYTTRAQNDLQEVLEPTGQISFGVSKQVFKNKGTLRFLFRDVFYTQAMAGLTYFENVTEYFKLKRDTQVAGIAFTYRFGKAMKQQARRTSGAANDEMERVGTVN